MRQATTKLDALASARRLADAAAEAVEGAVAAGARLTDGGKLIDEHQVHAERIAQLATEARAARELVAYGERQVLRGKDRRDALAEEQAFAFSAEVCHRLRAAVEADPEAFGLDQRLRKCLDDAELRSLVRAGLSEARYRSIGSPGPPRG